MPARERVFQALTADVSPEDLMRLRCDSQSMNYYGDLSRYISGAFKGSETLSLLDVGPRTGAGLALLRLLHHPQAFTRLKFDPVVGIDIDPGFERTASVEFPDIVAKVGDIFDLPDGSYDIVTCSHTIEHIPDAEAFVAKLIRIARRGVVIACPFEEKDRVPGHVRSIDRNFFEELQFDDLEIYDSNHWHNGLCCLAYKLTGPDARQPANASQAPAEAPVPVVAPPPAIEAPPLCAMTCRDKAEEHVQAGQPVARAHEGVDVASKKCAECGYVFFPTPSADVLDRFYQTTYPEGSASWYNVENDYADWKRGPRAQRILDLSSRFGVDTGVYHEVGCAFGGTVFEIQSRGRQASGTDLNASAIEQGRSRGADIHATMDAEFLATRAQKPNVLYGYHMLEHVPDPIAYLTELRAHLAPDSIAIFMVPNAMAAFPLVYNYMRYVWYGYPEHLHMFSPRSLLCLAGSAGFDVLHVATNRFGIQPEATDRIVAPLPGDSVAKHLRDHMMREALLWEELEFVLTPAGSSIAERFGEDVAATRVRCRRSGVFEKTVGEVSKSANTPDPWRISAE